MNEWRYENPEHVVTNNHRLGVLLQPGNWKRRKQIVTVRNQYVNNVTFGLENSGAFERS
jgi:hypothetical protein